MRQSGPVADQPPRSDGDGALVELAEIELTEVPRSAGGFGAIAATTRFLWRATGLRRGGKALLALNQPDGFDCPGCAWPEPSPEHRSRMDARENGAMRGASAGSVTRIDAVTGTSAGCLTSITFTHRRQLHHPIGQFA